MANALDPMILMPDLNTHIKRFVQRFGHDSATCFAVRKQQPVAYVHRYSVLSCYDKELSRVLSI